MRTSHPTRSTRPANQALSATEREFFDNFLGAATTMQRRVGTYLMQDQNTTLSDYQTLQHLAAAPGRRMRLQDLAAARFLSQSRISRIIQDFEKRGFVVREQSQDDRRGWYAILTDAGKHWLDVCEHSYASSVRDVLSALDPETLRVLTAAARRLSSSLEHEPATSRAHMRAA